MALRIGHLNFTPPPAPAERTAENASGRHAETQEYVRRVQANAAEYRAAGASSPPPPPPCPPHPPSTGTY